MREYLKLTEKKTWNPNYQESTGITRHERAGITDEESRSLSYTCQDIEVVDYKSSFQKSRKKFKCWSLEVGIHFFCFLSIVNIYWVLTLYRAIQHFTCINTLILTIGICSNNITSFYRWRHWYTQRRKTTWSRLQSLRCKLGEPMSWDIMTHLSLPPTYIQLSTIMLSM